MPEHAATPERTSGLLRTAGVTVGLKQSVKSASSLLAPSLSLSEKI